MASCLDNQLNLSIMTIVKLHKILLLVVTDNHQCFDTVDWLRERASAHRNLCQRLSKGSLLHQEAEENPREPTNLGTASKTEEMVADNQVRQLQYRFLH